MKHLGRKAGFLAVFAAAPWLSGFVLLSDHAAKLPVSVDSPVMTFNWDGNYPSISEKEKFLGGRYKDLEDKDFMAALIAESMTLWNAVPGAYVTLAVTEGPASMEPTDKIFSIVTKKNPNQSSAAFAVPQMSDDDPTTIADCDVTISDRSTPAKDLAFTLTHELGHCLGLGHAHTNYDAIMGYSRTARDLRLGADDMAGIIYLYPDPALVSAKPKEIICGAAGAENLDPTRPLRRTALVLFVALPLAASLGLGRGRRARTAGATSRA